MKATNIQTNIARTLVILFFAISFQSCNSSSKNYPNQHETVLKATNGSENNEYADNNNAASEEEIEQAAALLLLAAVANEIDNAANETYDNESYYSADDEKDYNGNDYDEGSEMIKDRIETEIGSNIVYE